MARPRLFEEDDVLVAARRRFNETGYHGTSVEELSQATGLSKGSLYGAFGDKEALFKRVFEEYCSAAVDESAAALLEGPEDQALDRLRGWLLTPLKDVDRLGCLLAKATAELAWENDAIATQSLATYETLLDSCRRLVEQAQSAGLVDPAADAEALGGLILTTHRGLEALGKAGMDATTMNRIAHAAVDSIALTATRVDARTAPHQGPDRALRDAEAQRVDRKTVAAGRRAPRTKRQQEEGGDSD